MHYTDFLKTITILYVEDDVSIVEDMKILLSKVFKNIIIALDGVEALSLYKESLINESEEIDIIISDINMPNMDGMELLSSIRKINKDIPYLFVTAHSDQEYLFNAIQNGISHYEIKPVNPKKLIEHIQNLCKIKYEQKLALHNYNEAQEYLSIINKVAIVSKTDENGVITFVNDIFCEVSGYEREELIGKNHNIVRHPDMASSVFKNLWNTIKNGHEWSGKVKNKAKNSDPYYVNATIFPLYNEIDTKILGYMAIRFLTTNEEKEKREFKTKVRELVNKNNLTIQELKQKTDSLGIQLKNSDIILMQNKIQDERAKSAKLVGQINYYEKVIKKHEKSIGKQATKENEKLIQFNEEKKELKEKYELLEIENEKTKESLDFIQNEFDKKTKEILKQNQRIEELKDLLTHREGQLGIKN